MKEPMPLVQFCAVRSKSLIYILHSSASSVFLSFINNFIFSAFSFLFLRWFTPVFPFSLYLGRIPFSAFPNFYLLCENQQKFPSFYSALSNPIHYLQHNLQLLVDHEILNSVVL